MNIRLLKTIDFLIITYLRNNAELSIKHWYKVKNTFPYSEYFYRYP